MLPTDHGTCRVGSGPHSDQVPIFISIDDTVVPKTKPPSKAKRPTEGAGWHYSHLEGKIVYGYQVHAAIVSTGKTALCYSLKRYSKEGGTKVKMTLDIIQGKSIYSPVSPICAYLTFLMHKHIVFIQNKGSIYCNHQ